MGLFDFFQQSHFVTDEDLPLSRLRHAIWGDWFESFEIKKFPKPHGVFFLDSGKKSSYTATLKECTCNDRTDSGTLIRPCAHMYRLAIETGKLQAEIGDTDVPKIIHEMRTPLFNSFYNGVISRGYYRMPHKWSLSSVTFEEIKALGLIRGDKEEYWVTDYFFRNATAFVYFTMIDPRRK